MFSNLNLYLNYIFQLLDVNECEDSSICGEFKQKCENTPGSYFCGCDDGFHMSPEGKCVMVPPPGKLSYFLYHSYM